MSEKLWNYVNINEGRAIPLGRRGAGRAPMRIGTYHEVGNMLIQQIDLRADGRHVPFAVLNLCAKHCQASLAAGGLYWHWRVTTKRVRHVVSRKLREMRRRIPATQGSVIEPFTM